MQDDEKEGKKNMHATSLLVVAGQETRSGGGINHAASCTRVATKFSHALYSKFGLENSKLVDLTLVKIGEVMEVFKGTWPLELIS